MHATIYKKYPVRRPVNSKREHLAQFPKTITPEQTPRTQIILTSPPSDINTENVLVSRISSTLTKHPMEKKILK